ncbi:hypothetical protein SAMN04244547_01371 [Azotobacter vinelandii]|nr:hypothetical protein SAMN04244547_01371 [Azotobacter vinelandii]
MERAGLGDWTNDRSGASRDAWASALHQPAPSPPGRGLGRGPFAPDANRFASKDSASPSRQHRMEMTPCWRPMPSPCRSRLAGEAFCAGPAADRSRPWLQPRVGILRIIQHPVGQPGFHHPRATHHHQPIGQQACDGRVVNDDHHARAAGRATAPGPTGSSMMAGNRVADDLQALLHATGEGARQIVEADGVEHGEGGPPMDGHRRAATVKAQLGAHPRNVEGRRQPHRGAGVGQAQAQRIGGRRQPLERRGRRQRLRQTRLGERLGRRAESLPAGRRPVAGRGHRPSVFSSSQGDELHRGSGGFRSAPARASGRAAG